MRQLNQAIVNAASNATTTFSQIDVGQMYEVSLIANFSDAAAAGTLKAQVSNDVPPNGNPLGFIATNWVDLPSATVTVASGATSIVPMPVNMTYRWMRLVWTKTAGAGTITVNVNYKFV
jgi:hypothetical protein